MVLIWHYIACQEKILVQGTLLSALHFPTKYCWAGVDLFFVLSGFLIGGIILDNHRSPNFLKTFWIKRACRILPVYLLLLCSFFVLKNTLQLKDKGWLFENTMPWWTYFLFLQNIAMGLEGSFGANFFRNHMVSCGRGAVLSSCAILHVDFWSKDFCLLSGALDPFGVSFKDRIPWIPRLFKYAF